MLDESTTDAPRQAGELTTEAPGLWFGYYRTPGLEQYRADERYSVWAHSHRQLLLADAEYRRGCWHFYGRLTGCLLLGAVLAYGPYTSDSPGVALLLFGAATLSAATLVFANEQRRRNAWIGRRIGATG